MSRSKIILCFCLCFIAGIAIDSFLKSPWSLWLGIFFLGISVIIFLKNKKAVVLVSCLFFLLTGILRHQAEILKQPRKENIQYEQEVILEGIIVKEPEQRVNQQRFEFKTEEIPGKILVSIELYPQYNYGDRLKISGRLKEPVQFEDFDYKEYLTKDKIYSVIYYSQIELISKNQGNIFYQLIFNFKDKLRKIIDKTLLPPKSSILKAVFLGDKYSLSDGLKEKLNITGTRHIAAISGMHMIIMVEILLCFFLSLGFWRKHAFYFVLFFLIIYIIMIGAPSSAIRAGIMAGLLLSAQNLGRLRSASRAVVYAAFLMLLINPLLLKIDAGFQLSFIATLSIIYLKPILDNILKKIPNIFGFRDILTLTLAAQIGVLPVLIFHFGQVSLISPLANLLVVPFLPFLMIGGLIISFSGLVYLPLARLLAYPVWLLLGYFIKTIYVLADFPLAGFEFKNVSWIVFIAYYIILFYLVFKKEKPPVLISGGY